MRQLPDTEIYRLEMKFMPWGLLMEIVLSRITQDVPYNGTVLDLMCGPGYLLDLIRSQRTDLVLTGVDVDPRYTSYGARSTGIRYIKSDVRTWNDDNQYDCIICTGGIHHLPYNDQPKLFIKMARLMKSGGFCICADPCISEYANEPERKLAAAELGYQYLLAVINNGAPPSIINVAVDILHNDVLADGEYKNSLSHLVEMAKQAFKHVEIAKVWPEISTEYGDYYLILR